MSTLYIITTPIGNLEDFSYRGVRILREVDALACEDTRRTRILLNHYNIPIPKQFFSYHEHNEVRASHGIINLLIQGKQVAICSDGGSPGISDPGYRVISEALTQGIPVEVIPGPSAVITGLVRSGLPCSSFTFKGFPPKKTGQRKHFFEADQTSIHTQVFYESPHRIVDSLKDALEVFGNRLAAVCVELTKMFEHTYRGYLEDILEELKTIQDEEGSIKGEITCIVAGDKRKFYKPKE